uniref:Phospholipase A2 n=1 Tax=Leptobrachium leishanense TaxID=445787 RepID=A0A8C5Q8M9_9ANUR
MASSWYILALLFAAVTITQCDILTFAKMIWQVTGRGASRYLSYGCYCGYGGHGRPLDKTDCRGDNTMQHLGLCKNDKESYQEKCPQLHCLWMLLRVRGSGQPKDLTDWCCHKHDCCYGYVEKTCPLDPKIKSYYYTIVDGNVLCDYQKNFDDCASLTCECDREAAYCFLKNLNTYDPNKKNASFSGCNKPTVPCS